MQAAEVVIRTKAGIKDMESKIRKYIKSIGFKQTHADHYIYINRLTGIIIAIWVDDLMIFGKDMVRINKLKAELGKEFEMKDIGELKYFLGIQVQRDRKNRRIHIDQSGYIWIILDRFDMENSNAASTPEATGTKLVKAGITDILIEQQPYQSLVGSQMYGMTSTRPDIA